jgi:hypothetical protein
MLTPPRRPVLPGAAGLGLAAALLTAAACGPGLRPVTGKVTWKGQPISKAALVFQGPAAPADGITANSDEEGVYQVGLPAGPYQVTISRYGLANGKPVPEGAAGDAARARPGGVLKHRALFDKQVAAGANTLDFELTEGKKLPPEHVAPIAREEEP